MTSHPDNFKTFIMLMLVFSFLGIFGIAELVHDFLVSRSRRIKGTRLYQGEL